MPRPNRRVTAHVPIARDAKTALEHSLKEAMRLRDRHISTGHLLLALVRDNTSYAALMLARLGLEASRVRDVAEAEIARGADQRSRCA